MLPYKNILLPENLNLEGLIKECPPQTNLNIENLKYILGLISELPAYDHRLFADQQTDDVSYVPLNSALLKKKISDYHLYLRYLVAVNILECDNSYSTGYKSKGYRYSPRYQVKPTIDVITKPKLIQRTTQQHALDGLVSSLYPHLISHFDGLEIDQTQAQHYIDQLYEEESRSSDKKISQNAAIHYCAYQTMINHLVEKTGRFRVDQSGYRFHSPLTNLKSELRNFLSYKGQRLVASDLSCSQPFFSTILFKTEFYQNNGDVNTLKLSDLPGSIQELLNEEIISNLLECISSITLTPPPPSSTLMCAASGLNKFNNSKMFENKVTEGRSEENELSELTEYTEWIRNGIFYENLGEQVERVTGRSVRFRQELKQMVFSVLFSRNDDFHPAIKTRKDVFENVFPIVSAIFRILKSGDHRTLAFLLQSIESTVFLNRIAGRITNEHPEIPLFSIHDSLISTLEHEDYVANVMKEELERAIGVTPNLKREQWG